MNFLKPIVPILAMGAVGSSIYTVEPGHRALIFDRFRGGNIKIYL